MRFSIAYAAMHAFNRRRLRRNRFSIAYAAMHGLGEDGRGYVLFSIAYAAMHESSSVQIPLLDFSIA